MFERFAGSGGDLGLVIALFACRGRRLYGWCRASESSSGSITCGVRDREGWVRLVPQIVLCSRRLFRGGVTHRNTLGTRAAPLVTLGSGSRGLVTAGATWVGTLGGVAGAICASPLPFARTTILSEVFLPLLEGSEVYFEEGAGAGRIGTALCSFVFV